MKLGAFVMIMTGIIIILNAGGVQTNSGALVGNASIVYNFVNPTAINDNSTTTSGLDSVKTSGIWLNLKYILAIGALATIAAGLITGVSPVSFVKAGFVSFFGGAFLSDILSIYNKIYGSGIIWMRWVSIAIFVPLTIYFIFLLLASWEGTDN